MIALDRLDHDIDRWEQELQSLEQQIDPQVRKKFAVLAGKMGLLRHEYGDINRFIEHARLAEATEIPMAPQLRAILFWARELAERIEDFASRYADYLEKLLWLNLMRGRLFGIKKHFQLDMGEQDVQQMLKRKQSLEQSEQLLLQEVKIMQEREQALRRRYDNFQYEEATRQAAQSFMAPLSNLSSQRTAFEAFGRLLRTMAAHASHDGPQVKKIQRMTVNFTKRSQTLMEHCSELLRQGTGVRGSQRRSTLRLMQENLSELQRLEAEIDTTLSVLTPGSQQKRPSFIVKKVLKQAKTIRLSHSD